MLRFFSNAQTIIIADNKPDILIMQANILPNEIDKSSILGRNLKYLIYVSICYQSLQILLNFNLTKPFLLFCYLYYKSLPYNFSFTFLWLHINFNL